MTHSGSAMSTRKRNISIAAVIACITAVGTGLGLSIPLLALLMERQGLPGYLIGLNTAMPALATLVATPFIPALLRRIPTSTFLVVCLVVSALSMLLYYIIPNIWVWFPLRFVNGLALTGLFVVSEFWINQLADEKNRGKLMGLYATILSAGFAAGPAILAAVRIDGAAPYLIVSTLTLLATLPILYARKLAPQVRGKPGRTLWGFLLAAPSATLAGLVYGATETNTFNMLPLYTLRIGMPEETAILVLSVFAAGTVLFQFPLGMIADRMNRRLLLLICAGVGFAGTALLPLASQSLLFFMPLLFIFGGGVSGMYSIGLTILGERFRGADLAGANASFVLMYSVGSLLGPPVAGLGMDIQDPHGLAVVMAAVCGSYLIIAGWRFFSRNGRKDREQHR